MKQPRHTSTTRGFSRASTLLQSRVRRASEGRGFAQTRLLTHWAEIAGQDIADNTVPVNISYGRGGMGATLTLLTTGAMAPMVEMQKEQIRERVNGVYGYNAISRIRWKVRSDKVIAGATVMESPVWIPIGSIFSMVQIITTLSFLSRSNSNSYSFHPIKALSIITS